MKKYFLRFLVSSWLLIVTSFTHALNTQTINTNDLTHLLDATQSMQANFSQTIFDNRGKAIQHSQGKMSFQRPGRFRWEVTKPIPQLIVANQNKLWIYDPDLDQVTIRSLQNVKGDAPALLLSHHNQKLEQNYSIQTMSSPNASQQWFKLIPKKSDNFASIQIGFNQKTISEMRLIDNLGHTTQIRFQKTQTNLPLSSDLFVFKVPSHVDIIDETRQR